MNEIEFHAFAMQRHFAAGRIASAKWHCARFTELKRAEVFNDGTGAPGLSASSPVRHAVTQSSEEGAGCGA